MSSQLDILALEPFYGGARKAMLETLIRFSRHRWTLLKLPPRRIERRLAAASQWFAEQLSRHWVGRTDLLFTSEAMNVGDLYRLMPQLARKPSVVYFHDNQLPDHKGPAPASTSPLHLVNLTTATAATELWFNSMWHLRSFLGRASALIDRHSELQAHNPLADITAKSHLMAPPIDFSLVSELAPATPTRGKRTVFVDTREADIHLLNTVFSDLVRRGVPFQLITVGPVDGIKEDLPRKTVSERDESAQIQALYESGIYLSTRPRAAADLHAVRALFAGCWPILPRSGVYPELVPVELHPLCLYDKATAESISSLLQRAFTLQLPAQSREELAQQLKRFDAIAACRAFDERLESLKGTKRK